MILRHRILLALLAFALSACAGFATDRPTIAPEPTATAAPPTSTPVPILPAASATPFPQPTPLPAVTPTAPATPDPNLGVGDEIYSDKFDGASGWFWTFADDVVEFEARDGELNVETKQGNSWRFVVRTDITGGDQRLSVIARAVACPGADEYGVMFRAQFDETQIIHSYIYKFNCAGAARVERLDDVNTTVLKDWQTYPAIHTGAPAENTMTVWMAKHTFHFFANDQFLFTLTNSSLDEGFYGFYVQSHSNGGGALGFDDFVVNEVVLP
ncbi:MAG: hypothetical protein FJ030_05075 [Chloroflexi bacterium]|nr:hypothetical protein [Chloroflexota bacterium]